MNLSAIVPCHPRNLPTLPRTLESVDAAKREWRRGEVETLVVEDPEAKGLSWARNRGLDRARGDVVFFVDADDTVRPNFFTMLASALESSGADFALSPFARHPLKRRYSLRGNREIRETLLPAFFGYSFDDIRRWNRGGCLAERRELGSVCRCAFRRDFLERHSLRFDENLRLYEDAPFLAECAAHAERVESADETVYDYEPGEGGLQRTAMAGDNYWRYKFAALCNRQAIAARAGRELLAQFEGSAALSALEFMRAGRLADLRRYLADPFARDSLSRFPLSARHPLVAAAVVAARLFARR